MNKEKLQNILKDLKYRREMAQQHMAVVDPRDWDIEILEAILED